LISSIIIIFYQHLVNFPGSARKRGTWPGIVPCLTPAGKPSTCLLATTGKFIHDKKLKLYRGVNVFASILASTC